MTWLSGTTVIATSATKKATRSGTVILPVRLTDKGRALLKRADGSVKITQTATIKQTKTGKSKIERRARTIKFVEGSDDAG